MKIFIENTTAKYHWAFINYNFGKWKNLDFKTQQNKTTKKYKIFTPFID